MKLKHCYLPVRTNATHTTIPTTFHCFHTDPTKPSFFKRYFFKTPSIFKIL